MVNISTKYAYAIYTIIPNRGNIYHNRSKKIIKSLLEKVPSPSVYVVKALKKVLKPLVNLLITNGITYPLVSELLKETFVQVAETDFKSVGKAQTDSQINFLTGIHRKDVKRLRGQRFDQGIATENTSLGALLVSRWIADPQFLDEQGQPMALPRLIKKGGEKSFEALVVSVNKDIRSRAILDEWLNMKIVHINDNDLVCLNQQAFIPENDFEEKAWFFGENLHDHLATAVHNLKANDALFERAVFYDQLTLESVEELSKLSEKLGMQILLEINRQALALQTKDQSSATAKNRMRFGLYFYETKDENADGDSNES